MYHYCAGDGDQKLTIGVQVDEEYELAVTQIQVHFSQVLLSVPLTISEHCLRVPLTISAASAASKCLCCLSLFLLPLTVSAASHCLAVWVFPLRIHFSQVLLQAVCAPSELPLYLLMLPDQCSA